jgi:hypothetical protein
MAVTVRARPGRYADAAAIPDAGVVVDDDRAMTLADALLWIILVGVAVLVILAIARRV